MSITVVKFGGTSMADAKAIRQVAEIIKQDKKRRYVVVSAPGKRFSQDHKVTDMLYACYHDIQINGECKNTFGKIRERFKGIVDDLAIELDIDSYLDVVEKEMYKFNSAEFCASRGEYLSAVIIAKVLGYTFVDAKDIMLFTENGEFDAERTNELVASTLANIQTAVVPGFYGGDESGIVHTFSRGGSDVSGAVIARAVGASLYENWTDVNGFMSADPRIVDEPKPIAKLSYKELRELAYMGANVLHPESIFPVRVSNIPINIRNTFCPSADGTIIVYIEKSMMNSELGFVRKVLAVLEYYNISFEHLPTGIDTMSIIIPDSELAGKEEVVIERIKKVVAPDHIEIKSGISLIATVGHGMSYKPGSASTLIGALAKEKINIRMIDQGSSEMNIIVGIATSDYERAIRAIYKAFQN